MMRPLAFVLCFVAVFSAVISSQCKTISEVATADFVPSKIPFLSSDWPTWATLRVHNSSNQPLSFYYFNVDYDQEGIGRLALGHSGNGHEVPWVAPPGGDVSAQIWVPTCTVLSDPCTVSLSVSVRLRRADGSELQVATPYHRYEVDADPTATFAFLNFNGNKPIFSAWGEADSTFDPTVEVLEIHPEPAERRDPLKIAAPLADAVKPILLRAGLPLVGYGFCKESDGTGPCFFIGDAPQHSGEIATAVDGIRSSLGARVLAITRYFTIPPLPDVEYDLRGKAEDVAKVPATRLAKTLNATPLSQWPFDSFVGITTKGRAEQVPSPILGGLRFDDASPSPVSMRVVAAFPGDGATSFPAPLDAPRHAEDFPDVFGDVDPIQISAPIESDRPEMFAVGTADLTRALAAARDPDALALAYARIHVARLARALGVREGVVSMVAIASPEIPFGTFHHHTVGLAMTFEPRTIAQRHDLGSEPLIERERATQTTSSPEPLTPMVLESPKSAVVASVVAVARATPNAARLDIVLGLAKADPRAVDLRALLLRMPHVDDASIETAWHNPLYVGVDVLLDRLSPADADRVLDTIVKEYRGNVRSMVHALRGRFTDCSVVEGEALRKAVALAGTEAQARAFASRRQLERLVLAVAYPLGAEENACSTFAQAGIAGVLAAQGYPPKVPLAVSERVTLTYRAVPQ
jgi:hypothetical protein